MKDKLGSGQASKVRAKNGHGRKRGKNSSKKTKKTATETKFDRFFGPILFGAILLIVIAATVSAVVPCKTGYSGKIWSCKDINECQGSSHKCSDLATCINLGKVKSFKFLFG